MRKGLTPLTKADRVSISLRAISATGADLIRPSTCDRNQTHLSYERTCASRTNMFATAGSAGMAFARKNTGKWREDIPGARWYKADLHIHTVDDLQGGRAKFPAGLSGPPDAAETLAAYARKFLQKAVENEVQVLGITPHSPRVGSGAETSAVWRVVDEWNNGIDDDGKPFREKIYAVFPGFEPSLNQGKSGLHLLFLFDPEIGRDLYLKAFETVMGGISPWRAKQLQNSMHTADKAFHDLRELRKRECAQTKDGKQSWHYIVLAPHIDNEKGLLGAQKAQVLQVFQHDEVAGLELGDQKLPRDALQNRSWLKDGMARHRQAFFHGSDAYTVQDIGNRHTWFKLASPRIEALRQAFIASDSRIRIAYEKADSGGLNALRNPPDVTVNERPWLKSVTISGGTSFFRGKNRETSATTFRLSPDLTCIIGGSMTGKSTFLDGLRMHLAAPLPRDEKLKEQVKLRGDNRFLSGSPEIELDCPGRDPTASAHERWPAEFFTQNELQRLTQEPRAVEDILARLVADETEGIKEREERLVRVDEELSRAAKHVAKLDEDVADAEQACERARSASAELAAFADAGIEDLHLVSRHHQHWLEFSKAVKGLIDDLRPLIDTMDALDKPEFGDSLVGVLEDVEIGKSAESIRIHWEVASKQLLSAYDELKAIDNSAKSAASAVGVKEQAVRTKLDRRLADQGFDGARIQEFQALNSQAALLGSHEANFEQVREKRRKAERSFDALITERQALVQQQRTAFVRVSEAVRKEFDERISVRRIDEGAKDPLDNFLHALKQSGITRWWGEVKDELRPGPDRLLMKLKANRLSDFEMSSRVQTTFKECLTQSKQRQLAAIRCPDRYIIEFRMDDGKYRWLDELSGGQRVSVLLSLLLETKDDRPLVIDQPEDELDNRFLFDTVLPALKRLKGCRQIIVATHNANIVVNGDADQVIQLEATANQGRVVCVGAIEEPTVRDAIVRTVDGGDEAFRLRRMKYGF